MIRVYQAGNNAEADMILSVLTSHGIEGTIQGYNHRSLLGFVGAYIQLNVLVPEGKEEEARQLIVDLHLENAKEEAPSAPPLAKRNRMVAFIFAFIFPGFGSLYLHRQLLGIALVSATAGFLLTIFLDGSGRLFGYAGAGLGCVLLCDLASAVAYKPKKP